MSYEILGFTVYFYLLFTNDEALTENWMKTFAYNCNKENPKKYLLICNNRAHGEDQTHESKNRFFDKYTLSHGKSSFIFFFFEYCNIKDCIVLLINYL